MNQHRSACMFRLVLSLLASQLVACAGGSVRSVAEVRPLPAEPTPITFTTEFLTGSPAYYDAQTIIVDRVLPGGLRQLVLAKYASGMWTVTAPAIAGFDEWHAGAHVSPDGARLYFESLRRSSADSSRRDTDLWVADKSPSGWVNARPLGSPFNSPHNEHNVTVSARETVCINSSRTGITRGHDILCARRTPAGWSEPLPLADGINSQSFDIQPFIDADEKFLLFASNRAGGKGSYDLYISINRDGVWQPATPLGDAINTSAEESSPAVSRDGRRLMFVRQVNGKNVLYEVGIDLTALGVRR